VHAFEPSFNELDKNTKTRENRKVERKRIIPFFNLAEKGKVKIYKILFKETYSPDLK
jgi:hypothetical protein